jgi:hypothetical protein
MDTMDAPRQGIVGNHNLSLPVAAQDWQTPSTVGAQDRGYTYPNGDHEKPFLCLPGQATEWKTPTANEDAAGRPGAAMQQQIKQQAEEWSGRQAPRATGAMSPSDSGPRRLNPEFVEWLMGWPLGWTDFAPVATEWSHWSRLMHSQLSLKNLEAARD